MGFVFMNRRGNLQTMTIINVIKPLQLGCLFRRSYFSKLSCMCPNFFEMGRDPSLCIKMMHTAFFIKTLLQNGTYLPDFVVQAHSHANYSLLCCENPYITNRRKCCISYELNYAHTRDSNKILPLCQNMSITSFQSQTM
jgi:hypothetical protein